MSGQVNNLFVEAHLAKMIEAVIKLRQGEGSVISLTGEAGFGKTNLFGLIEMELAEKFQGITPVYVESQAPIGKFNVGNIQPLLPFTRVIEKLMNDQSLSPEKKFAKNVLMTTLATMPIIGEIFYFVKETGKDWREYKKDKSSATAKKVSTATADFYDTILSFADKSPLVLLMDDMHWADSQSVELLNLLADNIDKLPIVLALSYRESNLRSHGVPLISFIERNSKLIREIELDAFRLDQLATACSAFIKGYKPNPKFEKWLYEKTAGVPGALVEYLEYYKSKYELESFSFSEDEIHRLPASVSSSLSLTLTNLTEEERNILATCSAEGMEFTAAIAAELLKLDVLTTIKKLRALQNKTNIIKSVGASLRYGVKTTVYRFTQSFYYSFFEKTLEYEEYVSLHGQIAAFLKQKYDETENSDIREQIAPYLAAHSAESGDEETARSMILYSAQAAKKYGNSEIIQDAYQNFVNLGSLMPAGNGQGITDSSDDISFREILGVPGETGAAETGGEEMQDGQPTKGDALHGANLADFSLVRKSIVRDYHAGKYDAAIRLAELFIENHRAGMTSFEAVQLLALAAKCALESGNSARAWKFCEDAAAEIKSGDDAQAAEILVLNMKALVRLHENDREEANELLRNAAELAANQPVELRLLVLTNIGLLMKEKDPEEAKKYLHTAKKLSLALNFDDFTEMII